MALEVSLGRSRERIGRTAWRGILARQVACRATIAATFGNRMSRQFWVAILLASLGWGQSGRPANSTSLSDTVQWLQNTLDPSTGNGFFIHHPFQQPYPPDWMKDGINPYHSELIKKFSVAACRVTTTTVVTDRDMGFTIGKLLTSEQTDTFDLRDIDPRSIHLQKACEPIETPVGPTEPYNCQDSKDKVVELSTTNNLKKIHREESGSITLTDHGIEQAKKYPDLPSGAQPWKEYPPTDLYQETFSFHDRGYTVRFLKAFTHAVELCGGKPSSF